MEKRAPREEGGGTPKTGPKIDFFTKELSREIVTKLRPKNQIFPDKKEKQKLEKKENKKKKKRKRKRKKEKQFIVLFFLDKRNEKYETHQMWR